MNHHSEPIILFVFLPLISLVIIGSGFVLGIAGSIFLYLWVGFLIWIIGRGDMSFTKTLVFWWVAICLDKPQLLDNDN